MQVLLLGAGTVTSGLNMQLAEQGHAVVAQIAAFTPQHIDLFDFRVLVVVSPESLVKAAERGKLIFVIAGVGDGMSSWANGVGVPAFAYPPSDVDINRMYEELRRAALKAAEGIAIVIKPEIPDLAKTRRWIARMINSLANVVGKGSAHEFIGSRVKLCYNQVVRDGFKAAHKMLQQALSEDKVELALIPNGILPIVDPRIAAQAVNSDRREDILIWRYKKEKLEELGPFADSLLGFAAHFVPAVREGASRVGLLPNTTRKRSWFGK